VEISKVKFYLRILKFHIKSRLTVYIYIAIFLPVVIQLTYEGFKNVTSFSENKKLIRRISFVRWNNLAFLYITDHKNKFENIKSVCLIRGK
jgi:hypothetical protein